MAASGYDNQAEDLNSPGIWDGLEDVNMGPEYEGALSTEESDHISHVGFNWFSARDLSNYISKYVEDREEFRQVYHLDGEEVLEEMKEAADTIDELLNKTISNINNFKEKAEYQAVKAIEQYDQIEQAIAKMEAEGGENQRLVREEPYEQIHSMKDNIESCLVRHIDNLEHKYDLDIRSPMASYEKNSQNF
jgi:hypothetical protein